MRKAIYVFFSATSIFAASVVNAQQNSYAVPASNSVTSTTAPGASAPYGVSVKVFNDFSQRFRGASDVNWSASETHTSVYFKQNGVATRSYYNQKGSLDYTVGYYYGSQVPESVEALIRKNGYFGKVILMTQVKRGNYTTQLVKTETESAFVTVQISNGNVLEYESYSKPK